MKSCYTCPQPSWRGHTVIIGEGNNFAGGHTPTGITSGCRAMRSPHRDIAHCSTTFCHALTPYLDLTASLIACSVISDNHLVRCSIKILGHQGRQAASKQGGTLVCGHHHG